MSRPLLERMTLWGQRYDQEMRNWDTVVARAGDMGLVCRELSDEHAMDMEALAAGAADLLSSLHVMLDNFCKRTSGKGDFTTAAEELIFDLHGIGLPDGKPVAL